MHVPVLAESVLHWLAVRAGGTYVDCTAGAGGHARLIADCLGSGRLIALDRDPQAVAIARERLAPCAFAQVLHRNYSELAEALRELGVPGVDGVLIDAGVSSMQIDTPERGFSLQHAGPLDMRMDPTADIDAARLIDTLSVDELSDRLRTLGDVRPARRIAQAIHDRRKRHELNTTGDLAAAVREALPFVSGTPDETRTVFQAIRMAVNNELDHLAAALDQAIDVLLPGGRLVVIAFHSGEDRVVKNALRDASRPARTLWPDGRVKHVTPARIRLLTKKPVEPDEAEVRTNPRAHSAKLRAAEKRAVEVEG